MITLEKRGGVNGEAGASFRCLSTEILDLPKDGVPVNSVCFLIDTQEIVCFDGENWI